jgi:hypothetical protein
MPRFIAIALLGASGLTCAGQPGPATALSIREPAFSAPQVRVAASMPPQFEIELVREMPTPGWSFSVDSVDVDEQAGRITARITEVAPTTPTAQVIASKKCRVPLGKLAPGVYALELWLRRGTAHPHVLTQVLVVRAR